MKVWYLPIERLEERYTDQMYRWVLRDFAANRVEIEVIEGTPLRETTEGGQFLNWTSTSHYKAAQLQQVAQRFHEGKVQNGDIFFVGDMWFPGIESIPYMATLSGLRVHMYSINYAGPFDPTDLTRPLVTWGAFQEAAWYAHFDKVFIGSQFHKSLILRGLSDYGLPRFSEKLVVTGLVWDEADAVSSAQDSPWADGKKYVIWPHRISQDKNLPDFYALVDRLAPRFPDVHWVITSSRKGQHFIPANPKVEFMVVTKPVYYGLLRGARLMLSTAFHENWGYTVREATALGTPVLCPTRADYPEMILSDDNLYANLTIAEQKIARALEGNLPVATLKPNGGFRAMLEQMDLPFEGARS